MWEMFQPTLPHSCLWILWGVPSKSNHAKLVVESLSIISVDWWMKLEDEDYQEDPCAATDPLNKVQKQWGLMYSWKFSHSFCSLLSYLKHVRNWSLLRFGGIEQELTYLCELQINLTVYVTGFIKQLMETDRVSFEHMCQVRSYMHLDNLVSTISNLVTFGVLQAMIITPSVQS